MKRIARAVIVIALLGAPFAASTANAPAAHACLIPDQPAQCEWPTLPSKPGVSFGCGYVEVDTGKTVKRIYVGPCPGP